jgi:F-type H+-transporting ATPase subunit b
MMKRLFEAIVLGSALCASLALAQDEPRRDNHARERPEPTQIGEQGAERAPSDRVRAVGAQLEHGQQAAPAGHGPSTEHGKAGEHAEHGTEGEHAEHGEHDENAPPEPINWWHGLFGEKAGVEPSLLWRAPGEPPPFLASLINFGVLVFLVVRFGKKPLASALLKRKEGITREIDDAQKLRRAAEERLREYEVRLEKIGDELERVRREFREQGERDKERLIAEAKERRERMQKDTEILLGQEAKQMRQDLLAEVVNEASRQAADILGKRMTLGDHDRFAEAFLGQLHARGPISATRKGGVS